jgi:ADP-heptose:LPS heptosyltransferase
VLALRALGLGDLLTAVPALRSLSAAYPHERHVLAAPHALAPVLELALPRWRLIDLPAWIGRHGRPTADAATHLPHGALAVDLHGSGPDSHRLLLAADPRRLLAFAHPAVPESGRGPRWDPEEHEVARWCRLLRAHGIPADPRALDLPAPHGVTRSPDGPTLIHPGAASAARRWPPERWAVVARAERARGRTVLLSGGTREVPLALRIAAQAGLPPSAVLAGRTDGDLGGLLELVAGAGRVACADTGVAHLATALRVPSVVLFGPTSPGKWGPPRERPWHRALWSGRRGDPHAAAPDPGLLRLTPADVLDALSDLPEPLPPRRRPQPVR